jgi:hypothetical protein
MGFLSRDMILGADDLRRELVHLEEWGGDVYVRMLTGGERELFEQWALAYRDDSFGSSPTPRNLRARLAVLTVCNAEGHNLFTLADVDALAAKASGPIERLFDVAWRLNRLGSGEVETFLGESNASLNGASGSV